MSRMNNQQRNVPIHNNRNEMNNASKPVVRARSVDSARLRRRAVKDIRQFPLDPKSLEECGYYFKNGKLVSTTDDGPFEFYVFPNNEDNHRRYNSIGRLVNEFVYNLLENECHLMRIEMPFDRRPSEPAGFFFASDDVNQADYLMIIIHGMGAVRAGQWSRKLIINEHLKIGTQSDYIRRAQENGYAVIVTNTNLNIDESSESNIRLSQRIRGSGSAEEHACYVWEKFVRLLPARHICIMAHSYGGAVVLELASRYAPEFDRRVFAVAFTDSPMKAYTKSANKNVLAMLKKRTINWVADSKPLNKDLGSRDYGDLRAAGHTLHEWTSFTAFDVIFRFFKEERQKLERS